MLRMERQGLDPRRKRVQAVSESQAWMEGEGWSGLFYSGILPATCLVVQRWEMPGRDEHEGEHGMGAPGLGEVRTFRGCVPTGSGGTCARNKSHFFPFFFLPDLHPQSGHVANFSSKLKS